PFGRRHASHKSKCMSAGSGDFRTPATGGKEKMITRFGLSSGLCVVGAALALAGMTGCATKNYVRNQTAPLVDHTNSLEDKSAENARTIHDVDQRAQSGIQQAQNSAT